MGVSGESLREGERERKEGKKGNERRKCVRERERGGEEESVVGESDREGEGSMRETDIGREVLGIKISER